MSSPEADRPEVPTENEVPAPAEGAAPQAEDAPAVEASPAHPTPATDPALLRRALEALLFITDRPLSAAELAKLVGMRDQDRIVGAVEEIRRDLEQLGAGYRLIAVAEGWQMSTRPEFAPYVRKLFADRATMRLSTAAQETLSIIAYRQPLTRAEIEEIRGVEVIAALETLLEKRLTKVVGRKETVGRPLMYGTTAEFLRHFGLRSLEDLPPLDNFAPAEDAPAASAPADAAAAPTPEMPPAGEGISSETEEAAIAEALSEHPAEETASAQTEEAVIAETLSEHPGGEDAPEDSAGEDKDEDSLWPK